MYPNLDAYTTEERDRIVALLARLDAAHEVVRDADRKRLDVADRKRAAEAARVAVAKEIGELQTKRNIYGALSPEEIDAVVGGGKLPQDPQAQLPELENRRDTLRREIEFFDTALKSAINASSLAWNEERAVVAELVEAAAAPVTRVLALALADVSADLSFLAHALAYGIHGHRYPVLPGVARDLSGSFIVHVPHFVEGTKTLGPADPWRESLVAHLRSQLTLTAAVAAE